jgi:hypothetical protein
MATQDQIRILELFNEQVEKLQRFSFLEGAAKGGAIIEWNKGIGWDGIHVGAQEESVYSAVLIIRLFIQKKEAISLVKMANLYQKIRVDAAIVDRFLKLNQRINDYLDSPSNLAISDIRKMTHREIMKMFIYGDMAHINKNVTYKAVSETPFFPLFQADFDRTLCYVIKGLIEIRDINKKAIAELSA